MKKRNHRALAVETESEISVSLGPETKWQGGVPNILFSLVLEFLIQLGSLSIGRDRTLPKTNESVGPELERLEAIWSCHVEFFPCGKKTCRIQWDLKMKNNTK